MRLNTESAFATDGSGTLGNFVDVPFVEGTATVMLERDMLNPEYAQQHLDGRPTQLRGLKRATLTFTLNLAPTGTAASNAVAQVQGALGEILKNVMGGEVLATGTTINDAGAAATDFDVTVATTLDAGQAVGVSINSILEARPIKVKTASNLTFRYNFSAAPSNGATVNAAATYYLTQDPNTSMQFILEGAEQTDRWTVLGGQLDSMAMEIPIGQLPKITFTLKFANWLYGDDAATNLTGSALGVASYTSVAPVHVTGHFFYTTYSAVTAVTSLPISQFTFSPGLAYVPITSPAGTQTISRWRRNRVAPVATGSFVQPFETFNQFDHRDDATLKQMLFQWGTAAGSTVLLDIPTAQVVNVQREGGEDVASETVSFECQLDQGTTGTTDQTDSAFRIHLL